METKLRQIAFIHESALGLGLQLAARAGLVGLTFVLTGWESAGAHWGKKKWKKRNGARNRVERYRMSHSSRRVDWTREKGSMISVFLIREGRSRDCVQPRHLENDLIDTDLRFPFLLFSILRLFQSAMNFIDF